MMDYSKEIEKINQLTANAKTASEAFIKQLLLMSSGLLGLLISLHKVPATSDVARWVYSIGMISLATGIVLLSVGLYTFVDMPKKIMKVEKENLISRLKGKANNDLFVINENKFYGYSAKAGYCALLISIVSIAIYGVLTA